MSAELAVRGAVLAALQGNGALSALTNGIYDGPPVKASEPHVVLAECLGSDWGTKDADGREVRLSVALHDRAETPARLAEMMALTHGAVTGLAGLAGDWRVASVALVRSRTARARDQGWSAVVDYRVRVLGD